MNHQSSQIDVFGPGCWVEVSQDGVYRIIESECPGQASTIELERPATAQEMIQAGFRQPAYMSKLAASRDDFEGAILARQENSR